MSLMAGSLNLSLAIGASLWSEFKPPSSRLAFFCVIRPLEVVYMPSGLVVHRLKTADLEKYLNKADLLTWLVFIFLQNGYLLVPCSYNIHFQLEYGRQVFLRGFFSLLESFGAVVRDLNFTAR